MKNTLRHLSSFIAPVVVCLLLPYLILRSEQGLPVPKVTNSISLFILGLVICLAGLALFITCVRMFILIGQGTIMPWDPTRKLITGSLYGRVEKSDDPERDHHRGRRGRPFRLGGDFTAGVIFLRFE